MSRATGRTSLILGTEDVEVLGRALDERAEMLEDAIRHFDPAVYEQPEDALLEMREELKVTYTMRRRVTAARDRLRAQRGGRGEASS